MTNKTNEHTPAPGAAPSAAPGVHLGPATGRRAPTLPRGVDAKQSCVLMTDAAQCRLGTIKEA